MGKAKTGSASASSTLKSPLSETGLTSKPDKDKVPDKDKDKDKDDKKSDGKKGKPTTWKGLKFHQGITKEDVAALEKARKEGPKAVEAAMAKIRYKLKPTMFKSMSARANTAIPVVKMKRRLQGAVPKDVRVTTEAGIAIAACLDYCLSELIDNSMQAADAQKERTLRPRHIKLGVPQDESLAQLFKDVTIPQGGTASFIHPELAQGYRQSKRKRQPTPHSSTGTDKDKDVSSSPAENKVSGKKAGTTESSEKKDPLKGFTDSPSDAFDKGKKDKPSGGSLSPQASGTKDKPSVTSSPGEK